MPLSRCQIRNEYSLADPELHRAPDKDDSEALLEGVAMAGLVGVLRQLGDLAQFAAEIFHDLHEEVLATAARGHGLMARVQQLEAEVPALEKAFLSQTHHSLFFTNGGIIWHPNLRSEQNLITRGDLPRFVMDSYEECRAPPRLFLLDKFDVAGAGACLKRYTNPSFFKEEPACSVTATVEVHREKKIRKVKKKGARLRNGEVPEVAQKNAKLHQLFLEEHIENACSDPARLVKLRKRQLNGSAVEAKTGKSYMEKFLESPSPDHKMVCDTSVTPLPVKLMSDDTCETGIKILEISSISPVKRSWGNESAYSLPNEQESELNLKPSLERDRESNGDLVKVHEQIPTGVIDEMCSNHPKAPDETESAIDEQKKIECNLAGYHSDDVPSEVDNYMDAESELETDNEGRPKKSILNIQEVAYSKGKEEHQLQARFSDSQSFGDSLTSDEIISFKDRNEELTEVQAHLSDSLSTGTSCTSDDDSSFRRDRNEEHMELRAQFSDSQSIGNSSTSDKNSSFKKDRCYFSHSDSLSNLVGDTKSEPIVLASTTYCESEIEYTTSNQLPKTVESQKTDYGRFFMHGDVCVHEEEISDSGQVSSGSSLMNSGRVLLCSDPGPTSPVSLPIATQSVETAYGPVELHLRSKDDEDRKCLVESIAAVPDALSLIKDDAYLVVSSYKNSLNNLGDGGDPYVHSDALLEVSKLAHEDECSDHSQIKVLQAESLNERSSEIFVSHICSQGGNLIFSSVEVDLNSCTTVQLDGQALKANNGIMETQLNEEVLSSVVETPPVSRFTEELCSDFTHGNPQDEADSAEVEFLYSDQQSNLEAVPRVVHGDEISGSPCSVYPVEEDGHLKHPSCPADIRQDNHFKVNGMVTEKVHSDDQAVSAIRYVDSAENDVSVVNCPESGFISSSSSWNHSNLQELFPGSSDSHQMEMESNEVKLTKNCVDLNAEKKDNRLELSSDITSLDILSSPMRNLAKLEESLSTFSDPQEKEMEVNKAVARESLTELEAQMVADQPEIASADVQLNLNRSVPCNPSDSEICNHIQDSALKVQIQYCSSDNDVKMVPVFSVLDSLRSESIFLCQDNLLQNGKDCLSSPSYNQLESETHLEPFLPSQVGWQDAGFLLRDEKNCVSEKFQSQQMQISNQLEQERISCAASEFAPEIHPDEPSSCDSSSHSSGQEINPTNLVKDPLKPLLPDLFPKETKINLEEMPPMPPLPPMQWRMGKGQHTYLVSQREETEISQASFQPIHSVKPDDSQFGLVTYEKETLLYQSPFFPVVAVESDKLQHSGFSVGVSEHPAAVPLQFPIMVNETNGQYNYLVVERNQIQNPFRTLPVVSTGRPLHSYVVASEEEMVQNSSPGPPMPPTECAVSGDDSISLQEKLTQPSSQLMEETNLEVKTPKQPSSNLEGEQGDPSSSNLEGEQGDPSISSLSPPSMESLQPNHSLLPTQGEMALSLDASAQTSEFDSERPNGKPKNRLPRPRSPLIDAVAAHDKSKLRKVTERVRPQIAPKVDERDSLLEQIRTKSFNLKPSVATRPSIQGPKTNLKFAAILEKANALRQALAGSDEDEDADSWSDS